MTTIRSVVLFLALALATTFVSASGPAAGAAGVPGMRLKAISTRTNAKGASLVIEATDPVPYVATRPDPMTVVVDFRNVTADGVANSVAANSKSPISAVVVERPDASDGPGSRVRITLAQPVAHHVRSDRNSVIIDFEPLSPTRAASVLPPMTRNSPAGSSAPDALQALAAPGMVDPIAALGLSPKAPSTAFQQTAPQAPAAPSQVPAPAAPRQSARFTGHPISLDFQGADLRAVLRTFAEISGLNMVIDPAVTGSVDVALRDVPWDQALDIILRANKLGYVVDGTIVRIAPLATLADEETSRRKLNEEQALSGDLRVVTKTLSYAKAEELQGLLTKSALSPRGTVQVDQRTNTLIITDLQEKLTLATELITTLDRPQPQVEIEARIVQTNKNYARTLGIQWGFNGNVSPALGNTTNLAFPNSVNLGGTAGQNNSGGAGSGATGVPGGTVVNLGAGGATSAVGLALGSVNGAFNLDVALSALETSGNGRILSTPRVTTQNNIAAEMTQGTQIPIQTIANNTVTVSFKDAALTLKVTPQITASGTVIMAVALENSQADFSRAVNGVPPINTQRANTSVLVNDGQTTVIGGVFVSNEQNETDRTPGLGQVPLLRWLFKRDVTNSTNQELLIFITPRIIKG